MLNFFLKASQVPEISNAEAVAILNRRRHSASEELTNSVTKLAEMQRTNSLSITEEGDDHDDDTDEKTVREPFKEKILNTKLNEENGDQVPMDKLMMRRQSQAPPLLPHE